VHSVADGVAAAGRIIFQNAPEKIGQVRDVHRRPVLLPGADHDQVPGVVPGGGEKRSGNRSSAVAVGGTGDDHDSAHISGPEDPAFDRLFPRHQRRRVEDRLLGDGGVVPVDPQADPM
jgi:hypothetical protein